MGSQGHQVLGTTDQKWDCGKSPLTRTVLPWAAVTEEVPASFTAGTQAKDSLVTSAQEGTARCKPSAWLYSKPVNKGHRRGGRRVCACAMWHPLACTGRQAAEDGSSPATGMLANAAGIAWTSGWTWRQQLPSASQGRKLLHTAQAGRQ